MKDAQRRSWKQTTVGDLCDFSNGHGFRPQDWSVGGLPIIRIQNLNGSQAFNYYSGVVEPEWLVEPGTILFAWAGTRGVSFGPFLWSGPLGVLNQHIYRVHPKPDIDRDWLLLVLRAVTAEIERSAHGFKSTLLHVRKADITGQPVLLPPLPEQRKIAEILNTWDEAISDVERLIATLQQRRLALVDLLVTGRARPRSAQGSRWKPQRLGAFLSESRIQGSDGAIARKLTVKLYGRGVIAKTSGQPGSEDTRYFIRRAGQLIYSKLDFLNGAFGIVPADLDGYESTLDLPAFDISSGINPHFILAYLTRETFYSRQVGLAKGGRKARRVSPDDFLRLELPLPPRHEQDAVAEIINAADTEIADHERYLSLLRLQKKALMQQLLTGKVRVNPDGDVTHVR